MLVGVNSAWLVVHRGAMGQSVSAGGSVVVIKRPRCIVGGSFYLSWLCVLVGLEFLDLPFLGGLRLTL